MASIPVPTAVRDDGLTVVVNPTNPSLDVVFVRGFTGHPVKTWKYGSRRADGAYWPRDLLPSAMPGARIMTFGYDTRISHAFKCPSPACNIHKIAKDLLVALEAERRTHYNRPVLFVAHSLGGITVKEMLRQSHGLSSTQEHLHKIVKSTQGIVFFGTPHNGSDPRGALLRVCEKLARGVFRFRVNQQIVDALLPNSERLQELRDEFLPIIQKYGWKIHSFQEQNGLKVLNWNKVVDDASSQLGSTMWEVTQYIEADHMQMCRFSSADDPEYCKVVSAIERIAIPQPTERAAQGPGSLGTRAPESVSPEERRELLEALRFEQMDVRVATIQRAYIKTCEWFISQPAYRDWLNDDKFEEHGGFLWINGKAGTGKSTLMKYLLYHRNAICARSRLFFFFNARGESLEKSTMGLYRSLLLQILESNPDLQAICALDRESRFVLNGNPPLETLKGLFERVVINHKGTLEIFIDALDECDEDEIRKMLSFFTQLRERTGGNGLRPLICFSSRHYPHISASRGLEIILEQEEGHREDIARYVNNELRIGDTPLAETIRREVSKKASGIFIWVVLVVQILNKEYDHGQIHILQRVLRDIPKDLFDLFESILKRDSRHQDQLLLCIQLVLFADLPLLDKELYHAIIIGTGSDTTGPYDKTLIGPDDIDKFITSVSKGLVEVMSSMPRVQFIHESVRQFLLKDYTLGHLWPGYQSNPMGKSQYALARCCFEYAKRAFSSLPDLSLQKDWISTATSDFPFFSYASCGTFRHAESAEKAGVPQVTYGRLAKPVRCLRVLLEVGVEVDGLDLDNHTALQRAVLRHRDEHSELLLRYGADANKIWRRDTQYYPNGRRSDMVPETELALSIIPGHTLLHMCVRLKRPSLLRLLVAHGADRNRRNATGQRAIDLAETTGMNELMEPLRE
ncbi:hypothetical protein F5B20DRAFT_594035 [Whalleya microplaca]|nr:hypothetical protein F5B20DRAFT_594035 [Whalleya microplaca]